MDIWKYFDITHRENKICNPLHDEKVNRLVELLKLNENSNVLEIACGKAEFLIRLAETYDIQGIGIDMSPYCIIEAQEKLKQRCPDAKIKFIEMNGAEYKHPESYYFDVGACIGAEWIYGGFENTLKYLIQNVKQGGLIIAGCPFWTNKPPEEYLQAVELKIDSYGSHYENMRIGNELGLQLIYSIVSSKDDWDNYEGLNWYSGIKYIIANPDDKDNAELFKRIEKSRDSYLRWGRETLGWAIYIFQKVKL